MKCSFHIFQIHHTAKESNKDEDWCWVEKSIQVDVGTENVTGLTFIQKGFWMHVKSTHAVSAFILHPHNDGTNVDIQVLRSITPLFMLRFCICLKQKYFNLEYIQRF